MGRTKRKAELVYVDHDKYALIIQLAKETRVPRTVLWREALDDILIKYGKIPARRPHRAAPETKFGPIEQHVEGETLRLGVAAARTKRSPAPWPADLEPPQLTLTGMR